MLEIILFTHVGLGDFILNIPIINYLLKNIASTIDIICYQHNVKHIKYFFKNNNRIKLIPFKNFKELISFFPDNINYFENKLIMRSGMHAKKSNTRTFPFFFYDDLNINRNVMKTHATIRNTTKTLEIYEYILNVDYIFISNETSQGEIFDINNKLFECGIDKNNILVICSNKNIYDPNNKFYNIADKFVYKSNNLLILDYKLILENANLIILSDSSLFCFAILLNLKSYKNIVVVRTNNIDWNSLMFYSNNKFIIK